MGIRAFHVVEIVAIHLIVLSLENLYLKSTARSPKKELSSMGEDQFDARGQNFGTVYRQ